MKFLQRKQVIQNYNISGTTYDNWLKRAEIRENNLQIDKISGKTKIIDNTTNHFELEKLAREAKVYKNRISLKKTSVDSKFYKIFSSDEVLNIYKELEFKKEINLKYFYRNEGADCCDKFYMSNDNYIKRLVDNLIKISLEESKYFSKATEKINVIDIGPGNGYPVKPMLDMLKRSGKLGRYITIDISREINEITKQNVSAWFDSLDIQTYERDIENTHFGEIFSYNRSIKKSESNIIFFVGSTINNADDRVTIFKNLASGMLKNDLFLTTFTLDHETNRIRNNYINNPYLFRQGQWLFDMLGIDAEDQNNIRVEFNPKLNRNEKYFQLSKDYEINFRIGNEDITLLLNKDDKISYWKHYLINKEVIGQELKKSGLDMITFKKDYTGKNALVLSRLDLDYSD